MTNTIDPADVMMLTGNDLALAMSAASLAIAWHKSKPTSGFGRKEIKKYNDLIRKLQVIGDSAYPYASTDCMPNDIGEEPIMRLNHPIVRRTRIAAEKANKNAGF